MKRAWLGPFMVCILLAQGSAQQDQPVLVKEFVNVVNREIIVRVLDDGKPVAGLQRDDFRLSAGGHALAINGFSEHHRQLAPMLAPTAAEGATASPPRLLIIYFWIFEPDCPFAPALDYFFNAVYRPSDHVLLVSPRRTYEINRPDEITLRRQALANDLNEFTMMASRSRRLALTRGSPSLPRGSGKYMPLQTPVEVDVEPFKKFASSLQRIEMEKWVLVFCQRSLTLLANSSFIESVLSASSPSIAKEPIDALQATGSFLDFMRSQIAATRPLVKFSESEMERMFIQSGATFHLLVLPAQHKDTLVPGLHYEEQQTGWQDVFAAISSATGGIVLQKRDMTAALQEFSALEDIYYVLTYEPGESASSPRKIRLELPEKNYDLHYNNEGFTPHARTFTIDTVTWQEPQLKMRIKNYALDLMPQGVAGHVTLTLRVVAGDGAKWTSSRELFLSEKKPEIEMKLRFPRKGRYQLTLEAADRLQGTRFQTETVIFWQGSPQPAVDSAGTEEAGLNTENIPEREEIPVS